MWRAHYPTSVSMEGVKFDSSAACRCANATCTAAEVALSEVVLIATGDKGAWPVTAPHAYLMNYISNDQRVLDDLNGQCFDRLFVGSSQVLDFNQNM